MLTELLNALSRCDACSFHDPEHPPIVPARLSNRASIMFIGENPSWQFGQRVPFDGVTISGSALYLHYLTPLSRNLHLSETDFWITDLFKCRYPRLIYRRKALEQNLINTNASLGTSKWLLEEIALLQPKVIVTLGDREVSQRFRRAFGFEGTWPSAFADAACRGHSARIRSHDCYVLPACHPDISFENSRKPGPSRKWSVLHRAHFVKKVRELLNRAPERGAEGAE